MIELNKQVEQCLEYIKDIIKYSSILIVLFFTIYFLDLTDLNPFVNEANYENLRFLNYNGGETANKFYIFIKYMSKDFSILKTLLPTSIIGILIASFRYSLITYLSKLYLFSEGILTLDYKSFIRSLSFLCKNLLKIFLILFVYYLLSNFSLDEESVYTLVSILKSIKFLPVFIFALSSITLSLFIILTGEHILKYLFKKESKGESKADQNTDEPVNSIFDIVSTPEDKDLFSKLISDIETVSQKVNSLTIEDALKNKAYTIFVDGLQGSGKSSFLNMVKETVIWNSPCNNKDEIKLPQVKDNNYKYEFISWAKERTADFIWIDFKPIHIGDGFSISKCFIETLEKELSNQDQTLNKLLKKYESSLYKSSQKILDFLPDIEFNGKSDSILDIKDKISKRIKTLGKKIIISLDDIDRLSSSQIVEIINIINFTANFAGVVFIVALDFEMVKEMARPMFFEGNSFIESTEQVFKYPNGQIGMNPAVGEKSYLHTTTNHHVGSSREISTIISKNSLSKWGDRYNSMWNKFYQYKHNINLSFVEILNIIRGLLSVGENEAILITAAYLSDSSYVYEIITEEKSKEKFFEIFQYQEGNIFRENFVESNFQLSDLLKIYTYFEKQTSSGNFILDIKNFFIKEFMRDRGQLITDLYFEDNSEELPLRFKSYLKENHNEKFDYFVKNLSSFKDIFKMSDYIPTAVDFKNIQASNNPNPRELKKKIGEIKENKNGIRDKIEKEKDLSKRIVIYYEHFHDTHVFDISKY